MEFPKIMSLMWLSPARFLICNISMGICLGFFTILVSRIVSRIIIVLIIIIIIIIIINIIIVGSCFSFFLFAFVPINLFLLTCTDVQSKTFRGRMSARLPFHQMVCYRFIACLWVIYIICKWNIKRKIIH